MIKVDSKAMIRKMTEKGMSLAKLSEASGVDRKTLSHIVRGGNTHTSTLGYVIEALGVEPEEVVLRDGYNIRVKPRNALDEYVVHMAMVRAKVDSMMIARLTKLNRQKIVLAVEGKTCTQKTRDAIASVVGVDSDSLVYGG